MAAQRLPLPGSTARTTSTKGGRCPDSSASLLPAQQVWGRLAVLEAGAAASKLRL